MEYAVIGIIVAAIIAVAQVQNIAHNAAQSVREQGNVFYRAIIPIGAKLTDSKVIYMVEIL